MDLDKLKLKTSDELNDEEKAFIKENADKLNDEDKSAYSDFLGTPSSDEDNPEGGSQGEPSSNGNAADEANKGQAAPQPQGYTFKNEEEARSFIAKTLTEEQQRQRQSAIDAAQTPAEKKYVEDNWKPKTWNEGFKMAVKFAKEEIKEEERRTTEEREAKTKELEREWDDIAKANNVPARSTPEGQKILKEVYEVGVKYSQPNFTKAYELWHQISGGKSLNDQAKGNAQRQAASKVRGQTPSIDRKPNAAPKSYQELHNKTTSQLMRDAMRAVK